MSQDISTSLARRLLPRFALGMITATPGAMAVLKEHHGLAQSMISRHAYGDWGILDEDDKEANEMAVQQGGRILSAYVEHETKFYVITSDERTDTCILLPSEY